MIDYPYKASHESLFDYVSKTQIDAEKWKHDRDRNQVLMGDLLRLTDAGRKV